jgi:hypothetical protein
MNEQASGLRDEEGFGKIDCFPLAERMMFWADHFELALRGSYLFND